MTASSTSSSTSSSNSASTSSSNSASTGSSNRPSSRSPSTSSLLELSDGRSLELHVSGPDGAMPLLFHHGTPGSSGPLRIIERAAHERDLRYVTYSRPGYGGSSRHDGRRVVDAVDDSMAILDRLGADRCLVVGWSGGGPHAMACAARLEPAVATAVIAGVAPYDAEGLDWMDGMGEGNIEEFGAALAGREVLAPALAEAAAAMCRSGLADLKAEMASLLSTVDEAAFDGEFGEDLLAMLHQGLAAGADGWVDDDLAFIAPWGFELDEISRPLALWQGTEDLMVPLAHGRWLAAHLPTAISHFEAGEGHLSLLARIGRMLDELLDEAP